MADKNEAHLEAVKRIKEICKDKGITPAAFARLVGVSRQQVYRWFSYEQRIPDLKIESAAEALGVHPAKLRYEHQGAEIDKDRLAKIIVNCKEEAKKRRINITDAQFAQIVATVYTNGNGKGVNDFLDLLAV